MTIKLSMILAVLTLFIISCNKNDSGNSKPLSDEETILNANVLDLQGRLQPNKYEILSTTDNKQSEPAQLAIYYALNDGIGCKKDANGKFYNSYEESKIIDKDLKVNDEFVIHNLSSTTTSSWESSSSSTLAQVQNQKFTYNVNILFSKDLRGNLQLGDITSLFASTPHGTKTYENLSNDPSHEYNYSQKGRQLIDQMKKSNTQNVYWSCYIPNSTTSNSKTSLIKYDMNGKSITALLTETSITGKMECEKKISGTETEKDQTVSKVTLENGESQWSHIESRQIKSSYLVDCRGETLYRSSVHKVNGKLIDLYQEKLLKAPVR